MANSEIFSWYLHDFSTGMISNQDANVTYKFGGLANFHWLECHFERKWMVKRFLDVYITIAEKEEQMDHFNPWMQMWTCEIPFPQLTYIINYNHIYIYNYRSWKQPILVSTGKHQLAGFMFFGQITLGVAYLDAGLWRDAWEARRDVSLPMTFYRLNFHFKICQVLQFPIFYPCKITRLKRQSHIFGFNNRHFEL